MFIPFDSPFDVLSKVSWVQFARRKPCTPNLKNNKNVTRWRAVLRSVFVNFRPNASSYQLATKNKTVELLKGYRSVQHWWTTRS